MTVQEVLYKYLRDNKIKSKDFAIKCDISNAQLSQIMSGKCSLSLKMFNVIKDNLPIEMRNDLDYGYFSYLSITTKKIKVEELEWVFNYIASVGLNNELCQRLDSILVRYIENEELENLYKQGMSKWNKLQVQD